MKKLIGVLFIMLFCTGCMTTSIPGMGFVQTDPGVRVYQNEKVTLVHVTYKPGEEAPKYRDIALILKNVFK